MLVDIFARRYESLQLRDSFEPRDSRLLVQAFRILAEDLSPYYIDGKENPESVDFWTSLESSISRELGVKELSNHWFSYKQEWNGASKLTTQKYSMFSVCENWFMQKEMSDFDTYIKERLSLIEFGFRKKGIKIDEMNAEPVHLFRSLASLGSPDFRTQEDYADSVKRKRAKLTSEFSAAVDELNARFHQAKYTLHYHNGFIQILTDDRIQTQIESPFWALVADPIWKNVDEDMKEALDQRDSGGSDPALYAARALESTIKIISDQKGWTHGNEKGVARYIDNIGSKKNKFILQWESESLKQFFFHVRNPLAHGAGSIDSAKLTRHQTEWAIEFCMIWIKNLIRRL